MLYSAKKQQLLFYLKKKEDDFKFKGNTKIGVKTSNGTPGWSKHLLAMTRIKTVTQSRGTPNEIINFVQ